MSDAKDPKALAAYYKNCGIPKGVTRAEIKEKNDAQAKEDHRDVRGDILAFWKFTCAAFGVSPVCTRRATDPHELVRRGAGGKVSLDNSVASCRTCHKYADGQIGGNQLDYDWKGKADGLPPIGASLVKGAVWAVWKPRPPRKTRR